MVQDNFTYGSIPICKQQFIQKGNTHIQVYRYILYAEITLSAVAFGDGVRWPSSTGGSG